MKKTLTALCVLGAFTGSAMAADVTISGVVDTGLMYLYTSWDNKITDATEYQGSGSTHDWSMASGQNASTRIMIAGSEDLGNNTKVSFRLENGFNSDTGEFGDADRLFNREASLSLHTQYGTVSFGRMGGVASSAGTYDVVYATAEAFDGGDNYVFGLNYSDRYDNMVTYQTPTVVGLQATVQYSFQEDSVAGADQTEGKSSTNRYASAAVTGSFGALNVVAAYEYQNFATDEVKFPNRDDAHTYYIGGNYDCGFAKTFALVQYYDGARNFGWIDWTNALDITETKGYGMHLGTIFPVAAGQMTVGLYYNNAEVSSLRYDNKDEVDYYGVSARYVYPLSKRTEVYAGAGYAYQNMNFGCPDSCEGTTEIVQAYMGLTHKF